MIDRHGASTFAKAMALLAEAFGEGDADEVGHEEYSELCEN
jgi:hypothetical protein